MPYSYVQAGRTFHKVDQGGVATEITFPDGLTLESETGTLRQTRMRHAILDRRVCIVNSPSHNFMMLQGDPVKRTPDQIVSMSPVAPNQPLRLSSSGSEGLTGTYKFKCSFLVKDEKGRVVAESPLSEEASIVVDGEAVVISSIPIADEPSINSRRIYRTLTGGEKFFHLLDVDGNEAATITNSQSDESIALASTPDKLGNPPGSYGSSTCLLYTSDAADE